MPQLKNPVVEYIVMLFKAHLTSYSRMSGSRWVITSSWLSGSLRSFLYSSSVYSCHLFLISSPLLGPLPNRNLKVSVFYWAHLCMKCSLGISNFLEEISSLSHCLIFLYFFALSTEEGFLIFPWYSLEVCNQEQNRQKYLFPCPGGKYNFISKQIDFS